MGIFFHNLFIEHPVQQMCSGVKPPKLGYGFP